MPNTIHYLTDEHFENKRILIRVDFNVPVNKQGKVLNDERMRDALPTLLHLLNGGNKLILLTHLGQPEKPDHEHSLSGVANHLQTLLPSRTVRLVKDFEHEPDIFTKQTSKEILLLENIRFWPGEQTNDKELATKLASLADIYVNEAFSTSHREAMSIVTLPHLLPSYGGLLLKKEVTIIEKILAAPLHPFVAVLGGAKVSTKITLLSKLLDHADTVLVGGGLANTLLKSVGAEIGKSLYEPDALSQARHIITYAERKHTKLVLPQDATVAPSLTAKTQETKLLSEIKKNDHIVDIGPETEALFGEYIATAQMIVWNGPLGYTENPLFSRGTDFIYYAITENTHATTIIGGGETIATLTGKERKEHITHISTGGGAMLALIEKGTLPGLEALER